MIQVYYPSLATSYAVYGRPYFLYQMYSFSCKHMAAIISDTAIRQCYIHITYILQQLCDASECINMKRNVKGGSLMDSGAAAGWRRLNLLL